MPGAALADAAECGPRGRGLWSLVLAAAGTRLLVVAAGAAGTFFPRLDYRFWSGAAEGGLRWAYEPSRILDIFGRWDTWYYLRIAAAGYQRAAAGDQNEGAFFPLFPMLVRGVAVLTRLPLYLAGLLVAWTCFALAVRAVHGLFADVAGEERATRATAALLVFPGSLFLTAVYTESLFLLLSATAVRAARWRAFGLAGLAAALAAGTRPNGVLVLLPVAIELGAALRRREPVGPGAALLAAPLAVLAAHAALLYQVYGDPLYFQHVQRLWNRGFTWPWVALLRFHFDPDYYAVTLGALAAVAGAWRNRQAASLQVHGAASILLPLCTGSLKSMPRFAAVDFPLFLTVAGWTRQPWPRRAYLAVSLALLAVYAFRFARGDAIN